MNRLNKLISTVVLVCFIFNTALSDLALGQTSNSYINVDTLATPSVLTDIVGIQHKDIGRIKIALEGQLAKLTHTGLPVNISTFQTVLKEKSFKERTIFQPANMQFFFHEIKLIASGLCVMVRLKDKYGLRTYYAIFSLQKDADGGFPINVYTEEQYKAAAELSKKLPQIKAEDALAIEAYRDHERLDEVISYAHEKGLAKEPLPNRFDFKKIIQELYKTLNIEVRNPDTENLLPIEGRKFFLIPVTQEIEEQLFNNGMLTGKEGYPIIKVAHNGKLYEVPCYMASSNNRVHAFVSLQDYNILTDPSLAIYGSYYGSYYNSLGQIRRSLGFKLAHEIGVMCGLEYSIEGGIPQNQLDKRNNRVFFAHETLSDKLKLTLANLDHVKGRDYAAGKSVKPGKNLKSTTVRDLYQLITSAIVDTTSSGTLFSSLGTNQDAAQRDRAIDSLLDSINDTEYLQNVTQRLTEDKRLYQPLAGNTERAPEFAANEASSTASLRSGQYSIYIAKINGRIASIEQQKEYPRVLVVRDIAIVVGGEKAAKAMTQYPEDPGSGSRIIRNSLERLQRLAAERPDELRSLLEELAAGPGKYADSIPDKTYGTKIIAKIKELLKASAAKTSRTKSGPAPVAPSGLRYRAGKSPQDAFRVISGTPNLRDGEFTLQDYLAAYAAVAEKLGFEKLAANPETTARHDLYEGDNSLFKRGLLKLTTEGRKGMAFGFKLTEEGKKAIVGEIKDDLTPASLTAKANTPYPAPATTEASIRLVLPSGPEELENQQYPALEKVRAEHSELIPAIGKILSDSALAGLPSSVDYSEDHYGYKRVQVKFETGEPGIEIVYQITCKKPSKGNPDRYETILTTGRSMHLYDNLTVYNLMAHIDDTFKKIVIEYLIDRMPAPKTPVTAPVDTTAIPAPAPDKAEMTKAESQSISQKKATEMLNGLPNIGDLEKLTAYYERAIKEGYDYKKILRDLKPELARMAEILRDTRPMDELNELLNNQSIDVKMKQLDILRSASELVLQFLPGRKGVDNIAHLKEIKRVFVKHPEISGLLIKYFEARFDPVKGLHERGVNAGKIRLRLLDMLDGISDKFEHDTLYYALSIMVATVKTDYYMEDRTCLTFRIIPRALVILDRTKTLVRTPPFAIIWVHVPYGAYGAHSRYTDVARGGLRAVKPERTQLRNKILSECIALSFTQNNKHTDIPEGGSKGAYIYEEGLNPVAASIGYVDGLINCMMSDERIAVSSDGQAIEPLELGPDEGTADIGSLMTARAWMKGLESWRTLMTGKLRALGGVSHMENDLLTPPEIGNRVTSLGALEHAFPLVRYLREKGVIKFKPGPSVNFSVTSGFRGDVGSGLLEIAIRHYGASAKMLTFGDTSAVVFDPQGLDHEALLKMYREKSPAKDFPVDKLHNGGFVVEITKDGGAGEENYVVLGSETLKYMNTKAFDPELLEELGAAEKFREQAKLKPAEPLVTVLKRDGNNHPTEIKVHSAYLRDVIFFVVRSDMLLTGGGVRDSINDNNWQLFFDWEGRPTAPSIDHGANVFITDQASRGLEAKGVVIEPDFMANSVGVEISSRMEVDFNSIFDTEEMNLELMRSYFGQVLAKCLENARRKFWALRIEAEDNPTRSVVTEVSPMLSSEVIRLAESIGSSRLVGDRKASFPDNVIEHLKNYFPDVSTLDKEYPSTLDRVFARMPPVRIKAIASKLIAKEAVLNLGIGAISKIVKTTGKTEIDVIEAYLQAARDLNLSDRIREITENKANVPPSGQINQLRTLRKIAMMETEKITGLINHNNNNLKTAEKLAAPSLDVARDDVLSDNRRALQTPAPAASDTVAIADIRISESIWFMLGNLADQYHIERTDDNLNLLEAIRIGMIETRNEAVVELVEILPSAEMADALYNQLLGMRILAVDEGIHSTDESGSPQTDREKDDLSPASLMAKHTTEYVATKPAAPKAPEFGPGTTSEQALKAAEKLATTAEQQEIADMVPLASETILENIMKLVPVEWFEGFLSVEKLSEAIKEAGYGQNITLSDDKSTHVFSEKATFGEYKDGRYEEGIGIILPTLAENGIKVAVIATTDKQRALIEELNKDKPKDQQIICAGSIDEAMTIAKTARYYYFKVASEPDAGRNGVTSITIIVKKILDAIGRVMQITDAKLIDQMHEAARQFAIAA